jgi:ElaB/YqjD/DUF883 family membrane-anchored ribosome-binding protein
MTRARAPLTPMTVTLVDPYTQEPIAHRPRKARRRSQVQPLISSGEVLRRARERQQREELRQLRDFVHTDLAALAAEVRAPVVTPNRVITNRANLAKARAVQARKRRRHRAAVLARLRRERRERQQRALVAAAAASSSAVGRPWPRVRNSTGSPGVVTGLLW